MARRRAKSLSEELRDRAARTLLSYAVLRWESAITLALTLVLSILARDPFAGALPFWRWWFWWYVTSITIAVTIPIIPVC